MKFVFEKLFFHSICTISAYRFEILYKGYNLFDGNSSLVSCNL